MPAPDLSHDTHVQFVMLLRNLKRDHNACIMRTSGSTCLIATSLMSEFLSGISITLSVDVLSSHNMPGQLFRECVEGSAGQVELVTSQVKIDRKSSSGCLLPSTD